MSVLSILAKANGPLERVMPLLTPTAIIVGAICGSRLASLEGLVPWVFAVMTFIGSLKISFLDMLRVLRRPEKLVWLMVILHVLMPVVGWTAGRLFFPDDPYLVTGYVLLFVIPTGVVSVVWVTIYGGNLALTLALILVDTLLSPLVVPASLYVLMGSTVDIQAREMMKGLLWMVVIPSVIGMLLNQGTRGEVNRKWGPPLAPLVKVGLFVVVAINGSTIAHDLRHADARMALLVVVTFGTVILGYLVGWGVPALFRWNHQDAVAVQFNSGMRNLSAGAVIAVQYFPPAVSLPVISGMLFQQLLAAAFGYRVGRSERKRSGASAAA
ncbi:bile acid:sodium symporter family protein [Cohnella lubricantis]|uniref:Bile acid:sodium symporter family protein n=1 Tax=Cohnella lubricantis TaxID=2163172 RepID=A0A841TC13_9BACL|nr:bile acid:sodium symporter family protein [Cohnella lubricantis]MBB6677565.1 bile acid:sodium symporter family protein [Cohnella lubricantis]MBP2116549.1 putative Na+-dependent transporter [Cohnella lubricantis]